MISVTIKSQFFYYIKIFAYEIKNDRGGQNIDFVEKNFFWKFFLLSKFSLEVRRSLKFRQILKILIFKDYFLTHATFLLTKYFSKFCHFFILLHKFQKFSKFLNFFQNFQKGGFLFPASGATSQWLLQNWKSRLIFFHKSWLLECIKICYFMTKKFYVVKFCDMMRWSYFITAHKVPK